MNYSDDPIHRLALGTVQLGLDYGLNNTDGKPDRGQAFAILDCAKSLGIDLLDTAKAYGDSEEVIGAYFKEKGESFMVMSKQLFTTPEECEAMLKASFEKLRVTTLYGDLQHDFSLIRKNPALWSTFHEQYLEGITQRIGISVYQPADIEWMWEQGLDFHMVQCPYSIFDRRFEAIMPVLRRKNVEVHVRSVFLQGLFFREAENLPAHFLPVQEQIRELRKIAAESGLGIADLCLGFAVLNDDIERVVIGVESCENLKENVSSLAKLDRVRACMADLQKLEVQDETILLPMHWKL